MVDTFTEIEHTNVYGMILLVLATTVAPHYVGAGGVDEALGP